MVAAIKFTYKDFATGRAKWTKGRFAGWTHGGPLGAKYAVFVRQSGELYVPVYCLTAEAKQRIEEQLEREAKIAQVREECKTLAIPVGPTKHLFGTLKGYGYFAVNTPGLIVDRTAFREMIAEANARGLDLKSMTIYGRICTYIGPGMNFIQLGAE